MLPLDKHNLKAALVAVVVGLIAWALLSCKAHAQGLGLLSSLTLPGVPAAGGLLVTDPPTEFATKLTAYSLVTGGGGDNYRDQSAYISTLTQNLLSGVNSQNFGQFFPGWVALPPNSTETVAIPVTNVTLATYLNAINLATSQMNELASESFLPIETKSAQATALLTATQANTDAMLAVAQEVQFERQLTAALILVEATKGAEEINERARAEATNATQFNLGLMP